MAFCPNCGTPNTDQAEKCVACGFELALPKQKPKFKGTIMMSGIKAPTQGGAPAAEPPEPVPPAPQPPAPAAPSSSPPPARGFDKTMLGRPAELGGPAPAAVAAPPPASASELAGRSPHELAQAPTLQQPAPNFSQGGERSGTPASAHDAGADAYGARSSAAGGGYADAGRPSFSSDERAHGSQSSHPPSPRPPNAAKIVAIGCAGVLALSCLIGGFLYMAFGDRLKALLRGAGSDVNEAAAWQASISQSLAQVSALCQIDCERASVFFHPNTQAALLPETKALTSERVQKLSDPSQSVAVMLDDSDDEKVATELGLDPQLCARVTLADAKVISCSVPDPSGKPGVLRIVHMSGIASL